MSNIMDIIAKETNGKSYKTFKYTYEGSDVLSLYGHGTNRIGKIENQIFDQNAGLAGRKIKIMCVWSYQLTKKELYCRILIRGELY